MDARTNNHPAGPNGFQRYRDERSDRSEQYRGVEEKPSVRDHRLGKAAVTRPAVKLSVRAKVLLAAPAKRTQPAGKAKPRRADPHARRERLDSRADFRHAADNLMAGNHARSASRQIAIDDMKVGSANAAGADLDDDVGRVLQLRPG